MQTARALRELPLVEAAYERGEIPVAHVRAITRVASNPRVGAHLPGADPIFVHQAAMLGFDDFVAALREWERLADADGADQGADESHERRRAGLIRSDINGSWSLEGSFGAMQGAVMGEVLDRYERAELLADWAEARQRLGAGALVGDLVRTPAQRRADALYAIFVRAASTPADAASPVPLVNVVIDQRSFEEQVRRAAGGRARCGAGRPRPPGRGRQPGHRHRPRFPAASLHRLVPGRRLAPSAPALARWIGLPVAGLRRLGGCLQVDHRGARLRDRGGHRRSTMQWRSVC